MEQLSTECKEKKEKVEFELEKPEDHLKLTLPAHKDEMFRDIGTCKDLYSQFDNTNENLKILENLQEDLSESLAPSDIKQLSQSLWLLRQRQSDIKHKLLIRMQILRAKTERQDLFNSHQSRFLNWVDKMKMKLGAKESRVSDLIFLFENHYRMEIDQKHKDLDNLIRLKDQIAAEKLFESDGITDKTIAATDAYEKLKIQFDKKLTKLHQILDAQLKLETELQELKHWLSEHEKIINEPWKLECVSLEQKKESEKNILEVEMKLKQHSGKISSILNQGEMLLSDPDSPCNISIDIINIKDDLEKIESRWRSLVTTTNQRKHVNDETWKQVQQFFDKYKILNEWIVERQSLTDFEVTSTHLDKCRYLHKDLDATLVDLNTNLNDFNSSYVSLAREGKLDENGEMKANFNTINENVANLRTLTNEKIKNLEKKQDEFLSFSEFHEEEMTFIRMIDAQLTEIQYSKNIDDDKKRSKIKEIQLRMSEKEGENIEKSAKKLLYLCTELDSENINVAMNELQIIQDDVNTRLLKLLNDFCCDEVLHQDQNIQVDTLKFEQDRSVQADTMSPHIPDSGVFLSNITSPSTPDYLAQLESDDLHEGVSLPDLSEKSEEQISGELNRNILECSDHIRNLEETLDISDDLPFVVKFC